MNVGLGIRTLADYRTEPGIVLSTGKTAFRIHVGCCGCEHGALGVLVSSTGGESSCPEAAAYVNETHKEHHPIHVASWAFDGGQAMRTFVFNTVTIRLRLSLDPCGYFNLNIDRIQ